MTTPYHARYIAPELTRNRCLGGGDRLSLTLLEVYLDLTPHQINAAAFALRNPSYPRHRVVAYRALIAEPPKAPNSKGVLLADEIEQGKTIEAELVSCWYCTEPKQRHIFDEGDE